jgi:ABC-type dipeptide/oligopeptide/nickel transport system ATPase component
MNQTQDHEFCTRIAIVYLGKMIKTGATEEMFGRPPLASACPLLATASRGRSAACFRISEMT